MSPYMEYSIYVHILWREQWQPQVGPFTVRNKQNAMETVIVERIMRVWYTLEMEDRETQVASQDRLK